MTENLKKHPPKGILKQSSSFDTNNPSTSPRCSITSLGLGAASLQESFEEEQCPPNNVRKKSTKFDEMNIIETLHPPDKDYGFMKIEEPKTPFNYYDDNEEDKKHLNEILLDPEELAEKIKEKGIGPSFLLQKEDEDDDDLDEEQCGDVKEKAKFESKRKLHYNEYFAVKLARQLMEKEGEEVEEEPESSKFIPAEETGD